MARPRKPHGTQAAFRAHKRENTRICDACQAWRDSRDTESATQAAPAVAESAPKPPKAPLADRLADLDPVEETLDNLDAIKDAIAWARTEDPARLGPLSKRKSELIQELLALKASRDANDGEESKKKLGSILDAPAGGDGDLSDNVLGFRKATA